MVCLTICGLFLWWASPASWRHEGPQASGNATVPPDSEPVASRPSATDLTAYDVPIGSESIANKRVALEPSLLQGRVVGENNVPLEGAIVSWSPLPERLSVWSDRDGHALVETSVFAETNANGEFQFGNEPTAQGQTVLWATHSGHQADYATIDPELRHGKARSHSFILRPSPGLTALVTLGSRPAPDALVWEYGTPSPTSTEEDLRALSALVRRFPTSADGLATLHPFPGSVGARATRGNLASLARQGESENRIVLSLFETFSASGFVAFDPELSPDDEYSVEVSSRTGHIVRVIGRTNVQRDGEWGPISIPLLGHEFFGFTLRGGDAIPVTEERTAPAPGTELSISFEAKVGNRLWAIAADTDGTVLGDAVITAEWGGESPGSTTKGAFPPGAEAEGYVLFRGVPDGHVNLTAKCEGYAPASVERIAVPETEPATWELNLARAAQVGGHVLYRGQPVETFEICYWNDDTSNGAWRQVFVDRVDGAFELNDVPLGDVWLLATGLEAPRSLPVMARSEPGEPSDVTLELQQGVTGRGTVVDLDSGEGITDATVQLYTSVETRNLSTWGDPARTASNGDFSIDGLVEGMNTILVRAEGYAEAWGSFAVAGGKADDLTIALVAPRSLSIALRGASPEELPQYAAEITNNASIGPIRFSSDGLATAAPLAPGRYEVSLIQNGQPIRFASTKSPRAGRWELAFDVNTGPKLLVTVLPEDNKPLPYSMALFATARNTEMDRVEVATDIVDGHATIDGLSPGPVALFARGPKGELLGHATATLGDEDTLVTLELGTAIQALRVVDSRGNPMPFMRIGARGLGDAANIPVVTTTNIEGIASFDSLSPGDHELHIMHEEHGSMITTQRLSASENIPSIEFSADLEVAVRVRSRGEGVRDVACEVACASDGRRLGASASNLAGDAFVRRISSGMYILSCRHPDYWPYEAPLSLDGSSIDQEVELLPLGALSLAFVDPMGVPIKQVPVKLEFVETGESVEDWMESGLLESAQQQATDADGHLTLRGIPCGSFLWRAGGETGFVEATQRGVLQTLTLP